MRPFEVAAIQGQFRELTYGKAIDNELCIPEGALAGLHTHLEATSFTFGTKRPVGVSIASPMLCAALYMRDEPEQRSRGVGISAKHEDQDRIAQDRLGRSKSL